VPIRGAAAELIDDLERAGFLPLQPPGIDGIDQSNRPVLGDLAHDAQPVVERAVNADDFRAVGQAGRQLAQGDLALGHEDEAAQPGPCGIGGGAGGRVAGAGANDRLGSFAHGLGDGRGHATILEGAGGVQPFILEKQPQPQSGGNCFGQARREDERRVPLVEGDDRGIFVKGQIRSVGFDNAGPHRE